MKKNRGYIQKIYTYSYLMLGLLFMRTITVHAYIDPSVVTYAIQAISGIIIALGTVGSLLFRRIRRRLHLQDKKLIQESEYLYYEDKQNGIRKTSLPVNKEYIFDDNALNIKEMPMETSFENSKGILVWIPIFLTSTMLFFGTLQMYIANYSEFYFDLKDVLLPMCLIMLVGALVLMAILFFLKGKSRAILLCILFGIAIGLFIQGNFVTTNYGVLNGEPINWDAYQFTAIWNTLMWIAVILIPIFIYKYYPDMIKNIIIMGSVMVVAIESINAIITVSGTNFSNKQMNYEYVLSKNNEFKLSNKENIIVFLLDAYDASYFKEFVDAHPTYKESTWSNFVFYPNTVGGSTRTVVAIPHLLTNYPYTTGETYQDYINESYENTNLYSELEKQNYDIGIFTNSSYVSEKTARNFVNYSSDRKMVNNYSILAKKWLKFVGFRYFPHIIKPQFWMYSGDFDLAAFNQADEEGKSDPYSISYDDVFYNDFINGGISLNNEQNAFRFYHLLGAHGPYFLKSDGTRSDTPTSRQEQEEGVWKIVDNYLSELKANGIYDSSNIIILADHGDTAVEQNPLFMVKRANTNSEFTIDERSVSYSNFIPTILEMTGAKHEGKSIFELDETDNATRYFYRQIKDALYEYIVEGDAGVKDSVVETGITYPIFGAAGGKEKYIFGTELYFDIRSTGNRYGTKGFRGAESNFTWLMGEQAIMEIPLQDKAKSDLQLHIQLAGTLTDSQRVRLSVNDQFVGEQIPHDNQLDFSIPKQYVEDSSELKIVFDLPDAVSASSIDPRLLDDAVLSIAMYSMEISEE
ncbi:MAG: sulfatase-like hydrolase/transferase [Solobacterium sp.]|nr:sulfatase-like hydrolase/transferase [Solobacterium sp.]